MMSIQNLLRDPRGGADTRLTDRAGLVARYGLAIVLAWFGAMKFTYYESHGISPLVASSPFMSWTYHVMSISAFGRVLGTMSSYHRGLTGSQTVVPQGIHRGRRLATIFLWGTLSFMCTTPGIGEASAGGFPVLSANGEFS